MRIFWMWKICEEIEARSEKVNFEKQESDDKFHERCAKQTKNCENRNKEAFFGLLNANFKLGHS